MGESICHFFAQYGSPTSSTDNRNNPDYKVYIKRLKSTTSGDELVKYDNEKKEYILNFRKMMELDSSFDYTTKENQKKVRETLLKACREVQKNISSRKAGSYVFNVYGAEGNESVKIYPPENTSFKKIRKVFINRLAEAFCSLKFIYENKPNERTQVVEQFPLYKNTYLKLKKLHPGNLPGYLTEPFELLKGLIDSKNGNNK